MRIAILHYSCPPVVGGVEEMLKRQAKILSENAHYVRIFAGKGKRFIEKCEVEINPMLSSTDERVVKANLEATRGRYDKLNSLSREILTYLREALRGFDVLLAHNVFSMHFNLALTYALHRLANEKIIPIVAWNHDSPFFYENYPDYLNSDAWEILKKPNPNLHYVVISEARKELFQKMYGKEVRIEVIHDGIEPVDFMKLSPLSEKLIKEKNLLSKELILFQPCRLHPRKNIELSIKVLGVLRRRGVDACLLITGAYDPHEKRTYDYKKTLLELAKKEGVEEALIFLAGYRFKDGSVLSAEHIETRDFYLISDILFFPSLHEGFGIPLLEAGLLKVPVLCSDIKPFKEIGEGVHMFSLKETPESIADKVLEIASGMRFFSKVKREYSLENIYKKKLLPFLERIRSEPNERDI